MFPGCALATLLHGCFSHFLNCTYSTKSRKASHIILYETCRNTQWFYFNIVKTRLLLKGNDTRDAIRAMLKFYLPLKLSCLNSTVLEQITCTFFSIWGHDHSYERVGSFKLNHIISYNHTILFFFFPFYEPYQTSIRQLIWWW